MNKTTTPILVKIAFKAWKTRLANKKKVSQVAKKAWITRKNRGK